MNNLIKFPLARLKWYRVIRGCNTTIVNFEAAKEKRERTVCRSESTLLNYVIWDNLTAEAEEL